MVYVDDFKMSGPMENLSTGWQLIRRGIKTDEPKPVSRCLGCENPVRNMENNMRPFMEQCVDSYQGINKESKSDLCPAILG
eukprot:11165723-Heterocapsa_arctica.AAC.1